jgi:hypothetical protein
VVANEGTTKGAVVSTDEVQTGSNAGYVVKVDEAHWDPIGCDTVVPMSNIGMDAPLAIVMNLPMMDA